MLKKRVFALMLVMLAFMGTVAQAAGPVKAPRAEPYISFSGNEATCVARVSSSNAGDRIRVTMRLWNGRTCLKTWVGSGTGRVVLREKAVVSRGTTYKLTVDYVINNVSQTQKVTTGKCP